MEVFAFYSLKVIETNGRDVKRANAGPEKRGLGTSGTVPRGCPFHAEARAL